MADQFIHTGNDPPGLKIEINPLTLKVLCPKSPVQPELLPMFDVEDSNAGSHDPIEDQFVDLLTVSNRDHVTTTTHNIPCTLSTEGIPDPFQHVEQSVIGVLCSSNDQGCQLHQIPFFSLPHSGNGTPAVEKFHDGHSLKVWDDASFEDDTKKSPPDPECFEGFQKKRAVPEGPKQLYTQKTIKLKKTFEEGKVVWGTTEALHDLVQSNRKLGKTTGVICNEDLTHDGDQYEEDAHYIVENSLGQGSFGTVNLAIDLNRRKKFVIKKVSKDSFAKNEVLVPCMLNQVNITRLYGLIHRVGPEGEYMELLIEDAGMALNKYRAQYPYMARREDVVWDFCKQGFRALEHMAKFGIIHLDIKPENVCLTDQGDGFVNMKMTDLGSARFAQDPMHFMGLTPEYLSPEVCKLFLQVRHKVDMGLSDDDITGKSDMFAFALVVMFLYKGYHILQHVLTNGQSSYEAYTSEQRQTIHMKMIVQVAQGVIFEKNFIPNECCRDMRVLLCKMLEMNPVKRISAREALQFIEKIAEELMESDHGPVKSATKDRLHKMIADPPYNRGGKGIADPYTRGAKGSGKGRTATVTSVMTPRHVASKKMPMSPMTDVKDIVDVTERNAPIAQLSADNDTPMDFGACPMIDIPKRPKPAAPQFVYQQPRRAVQRTTSDALQVECGQYAMQVECGQNAMQMECRQNVMQADCRQNAIQVECRQNVMQADCRQNAMQVECGQNAIQMECRQNAMQVECGQNAIQVECGQNAMQVEFGQNAMQGYCGQNAMHMDCGQMDCARTPQQCQVLEQRKQTLTDNQQREMFMQNMRRAGNNTEIEQNGPLDPVRSPDLTRSFNHSTRTLE